MLGGNACSFICTLTGMTIAVTLAPSSLAQDKDPIPSAEAQAEALALIKEVYGQEWNAAKTPEQKTVLAQKLLDKSRGATDDATRFALLRVGRDVAVQGGDVYVAFRAIDVTSYRFQIDEFVAKVNALLEAAKHASIPAHQKAVATEGRKLIEDAVDEDDFVTAEKLYESAVAAARSAHEWDLAREIVARNRKIEEVAAAYAAIDDAVTLLKIDPVDPEANLAVGEYHCFVKGNWEHGLPMLALGSHGKLKELAVKELRGDSDADEKVVLGDGWWDLALGSEDVTKAQLEGRAALWYRKALPALSGLVRDRVEERLAKLESTGATGEAGPQNASPQPRQKKPENFAYGFTDEATVKGHWDVRGEWRIEGVGLRLYAPNPRIQLKKTLSGDFIVRVPYSMDGHFCSVSIRVCGEDVNFGQKRGSHILTVARKGETIYFAADKESPRTIAIKQANQQPETTLAIHLNSTYGGTNLLVKGVAISVAGGLK